MPVPRWREPRCALYLSGARRHPRSAAADYRRADRRTADSGVTRSRPSRLGDRIRAQRTRRQPPCTRYRALVGHPAVVRRQCAGALPRAARSRTVHWRRLGHARHLPGAVRDAACAWSSRAGPRSAAARVRHAEQRRRLAAMVHFFCARSRHARQRCAWRYRVLAAARPGALSRGEWRPRAARQLTRFSPRRRNEWRRGRDRLAACRARHPIYRCALSAGYRADLLRPWRLERLHAAGRSEAPRRTVQQLDRHPALSDADHSGRCASGRWPRRRGRRPASHRHARCG